MPDFNKPFKPLQWPQDKLRIINGYGLMPPLDLQNRVLVKREGYALTGSIGPISYGQSRTVSIDIGDDGDFWLTGIGVQLFLPTTGVFDNDTWATLTVQDVRSGYNLFYPFARVSELTVDRPGDIGAIIQPYCFTRTGAIEVTFSVDAKAVAARNHTLYYSFVGWKEYADASK